jgi:hypothetical protein
VHQGFVPALRSGQPSRRWPQRGTEDRARRDQSSFPFGARMNLSRGGRALRGLVCWSLPPCSVMKHCAASSVKESVKGRRTASPLRAALPLRLSFPPGLTRPAAHESLFSNRRGLGQIGGASVQVPGGISPGRFRRFATISGYAEATFDDLACFLIRIRRCPTAQ